MAGGGEDSFIEPLGLLLGLTAFVALLLSYAKQSTIISFILVGVMVNSVGVTKLETTTLGHFSEVGILILLFMAGLEVELEAFIEKWKTVTIIGVGQIVVTTTFFAISSLLVLPAIGTTVTMKAAVYFGLCMCFSSTILVLGYLKNSGTMGTVYGQLCLGTLVLQDAASVLGIAVLSGLGSGVGTCVQVNVADCNSATSTNACNALGNGCSMRNVTIGNTTSSFSCTNVCDTVDLSTNTDGDGGILMCNSLGSMCVFQEPEGGGVLLSIVMLFLKLIAACIICFLLERYVLKKLFGEFARSFELLYLGSLGYATGLASIAVMTGFSGEITAFLAGVSIAQLPYKMHIETKMEPIKSLGVAIFFITLGLKLEVNQKMVEMLPIGFALAVFTIFATLPLFILLGTLAKLKAHNVFMLGLLMNQISEFSLILCTLCVRAGVLQPIVLTVMTIAAVVSIVISSIGHIFIDNIYEKINRWWCLRCVEDHHRKHQVKRKQSHMETKEMEMTNVTNPITPAAAAVPISEEIEIEKKHDAEEIDWDLPISDQLKIRSIEQLRKDLINVDKNLEKVRSTMAATADEKRLHHALETSHASDIIHGMIEGFVIVDHHLLFCTLRSGRMLFWEDQHDVGHIPPTSVWDISGMQILSVETEIDSRSKNTSKLVRNKMFIKKSRRFSGEQSDLSQQLENLNLKKVETTHFSDSDSDEEEEVHPWEWTIVLSHMHRHSHTSSFEKDTMKLAIHGLEDHSSHDYSDWQDALTVATTKLNPIAYHRALIREAIHDRSKSSTSTEGTLIRSRLQRSNSVEIRMAGHDHRNEIICIGYNEMFPAVLALADATNKDVVVVEYDPMKINAVKKMYNEEKRTQDHAEKRSSKGKVNLKNKSSSNTSINSEETVENNNNDDENSITAEDQTLKRGVHCEYADIHDPECWEELEMDEAFMIVCTMKGARHAEKAIMKWLQKHESHTIFIACTHNNIEAIQLYEAGAHFVMQTDALAMRSTKEIFIETVANVGDCSQLVTAGQAHKRRLKKLQVEDQLRFLYETG